jgi:hypothetical protein
MQSFRQEATMTTNASPAPDCVSDDFARPELGDHWAVHNGDVGILGGRDLGLRTKNAPMHGLGIVAWRATTFSANHFCEAVLSPDADPAAVFQVFVRRTADGQRFGFHWYDGRWGLKRDGLPNGASLAHDVPGPRPVPGDRLRIESVGGTLRGLHNGIEVIRGTDAVLAALREPGQPGLVLHAYHVARTPTAFYRQWCAGGLAGRLPEE